MLNTMGTSAAPLLADREMNSVGCDVDAEVCMPDIAVERPRRSDTVLNFCLVAGIVLLCMLVLGLFVNEWQHETYYRAWLLLAGIAPLSYAVRIAWGRTIHAWDSWSSIQVKIDSMRGATLFNAVAECIEQAAESNIATCSSDMESFTVYDKTIGQTQVRMRFWGKEPRTVNLKLAGGRRLTVLFARGDDVIVGRDHSLTSRENLILRLKTESRDRLAEKQFLKDWLLSCVERYKKPPQNVVEVLALNQSSTDWVPEWQTQCVRLLKKSDGVGNGFFLKRSSINPILADASIWCGKELRIYLVMGPPGTGKTELTIWLAGYLRVPLYRLSLNDARLSDQIFAQLISPTSLMHDNAVIQIDEFQETLSRWKGGREDRGVSMGGFCEVLQGSNSLARGFIILSGTQELAETMHDPAFAAVFRRISIAPTVLDFLSAEDLENFFCRFVWEFVPGCDEEELLDTARIFIGNGSPWGGGEISVDMVKRFLMQRISDFAASNMSEICEGPRKSLVVPPELRGRFLDHLCSKEPAVQHLKLYPNVKSHS